MCTQPHSATISTMRGNDYMSASSKKKLRKEQNMAALTEKQQKQRKEDKKLKAYTVSFIIVMVLILVLGHVLNLAINVLGTFVHTSRLQYIEFFGKFCNKLS